MKLGTFIVAFVCAGAPIASANSKIDRYRKQYEQQSNPALLVSIAHEYKRTGEIREALAYYCSYMYVDAAGPLADEASDNARAISATLGKPTQSDHEACSTRPPATREAPSALDVTATVRPELPKSIYMREILGVTGLGVSLGMLGLALVEARDLKGIRDEMDIKGADLEALAARERSTEMRQKMWLIGGGVVLLAGGISYVTGRNARKKAEAMYVAPTFTKGGAGLTAGRRF